MLENQPEIDYHIYKSFQILGLLGKGTYGKVYKVKHKKSQQILAIKKICDAYQNITDAKRTYRQLNYLFQLTHPSIVKLYQVIPGYRKNIPHIRQSNTSRTDFVKGIYQDHQVGYNTEKTHDGAQYNNNPKLSKHVYALFQYVETDLSKALRRCKLEPIQRKYIAYQILHGISYLHKSKLIHRDVKPSNILIDTNCNIKICDFGLCRIKQEKTINHENQQNIITQYVASRWYRPPQILLGFSPCNQAIDMWGVGCVLAQLILRNPIFQGQSTMDQLQKVFRIIGLPNQQEISKLESDQAKFLLKTFTFSRKNKPQKISEVLCQASDEQLDLIEKLLKFNSQDRFSAEQALKHKYFQEMQKMGYNFNKYNIPVKIIDHTDPSFAFGQIKNFGHQLIDKTQPKKKQISLEHYQNLIQDLERATSRSSNRLCYDQSYKQPDRVIEQGQNVESERNKEKSTRQSNFLHQHRNLEQKKQISEQKNNHDEIMETDKILENYNKQKSSTSSHKNLKIAEIIKEGRNAHSTMDNYYSNNGALPNYDSKNDILFGQGHNKFNFNPKCNKSVQDNLQETYGMFFNPFDKQANKKPVKSMKKTSQNLSTLQDVQPKKKATRKVSSNKSQSKHSVETQKDKSFAKNSSKNLHTQNLDETKNKYSSHTILNNVNESNFLSQVKGKIPLYKKPKDLTKDSIKLVKDFSKTKLGSEQKTFKVSSNKNNMKSYENLIVNPGQKIQKERKKSKDFNTTKNDQSREYYKKNIQISGQDHHMNSIQNCFAKIDIKQKQIKPKMQPKAVNQVKKKTIEKKNQNSMKSKSLGKKKSQTKIMSSK